MSADVSRRSVVRGAAWAMPVVLAAVAVPLAAASQPYPAAVERLAFNTAEAWDENPKNAHPNIGVKVGVRDTTGPHTNPVGAVVLLVELVDAAGTRHPAQSGTETIAYGWGSTPNRTFHFAGVARGEYRVVISATAVGVKQLATSLTRRTVLS